LPQGRARARHRGRALVKAYHPTWTNVHIRQELDNTARDLGTAGRDSFYGYGLINLSAAIP